MCYFLPSLCSRSHVGVHECIFRIDKGRHVLVGVVPVSKATRQDIRGHKTRRCYSSDDGIIYGYGNIGTGVRYGDGDAITVTLDFNANTVTFAKNGVVVSYDAHYFAFSIVHEAHYFVFSTRDGGGAVTITSMK